MSCNLHVCKVHFFLNLPKMSTSPSSQATFFFANLLYFCDGRLQGVIIDKPSIHTWLEDRGPGMTLWDVHEKMLL